MPDETEAPVPADPREVWHLPPLGTLPVVEQIGDAAVRVLAPNASPMTLDGTNTYLIGVPGSGAAVVVDPGPGVAEHRERVDGELRRRDLAPQAVFVTHHHQDHAEAAASWAADFGCPVVSATRSVAGAFGRIVEDGDRLHLDGFGALEVVATPGHTADHLSVRLPDGSLLTGDHVLGRGTSVIAYPEGDLDRYLASLRRVRDLGPHRLLPGHGPVLDRDPTAVIEYYLAHRDYRERQLLALLDDTPIAVGDLVAAIYPGVGGPLRAAATASTRAALRSLDARGRVRVNGNVVEAAETPP